MSGLRVGKYNLPVWIIIIGMVGAGSMTISSSSIVDTIDEDTVPTARTGAFTGVPVHFDKPNLATLSVSGNGAVAGAHILTNQQLRINLLAQVADPVTITIPIKNESEDSIIMVVKVTTDSKVLVDIDEGFSTGGVRLIGTNQWIMTVDDDASADFDLNVVALEPGAFFLLVEIFSVG